MKLLTNKPEATDDKLKFHNSPNDFKMLNPLSEYDT